MDIDIDILMLTPWAPLHVRLSEILCRPGHIHVIIFASGGGGVGVAGYMMFDCYFCYCVAGYW